MVAIIIIMDIVIIIILEEHTVAVGSDHGGSGRLDIGVLYGS